MRKPFFSEDLHILNYVQMYWNQNIITGNNNFYSVAWKPQVIQPILQSNHCLCNLSLPLSSNHFSRLGKQYYSCVN